jgi:hypothetical protein
VVTLIACASEATAPANVSKPAAAHPWPIDKQAMGKSKTSG